MQILLVDSSLLILQRLEELLADMVLPLHIHKAVSYTDGHFLFSEKKPEMVILDVNLPQSASYRLLKEMKETAPETIVITLSIHTETDIQQQCKRLGSDFFFDKYDEFEKIPAIVDMHHHRFLAARQN